MRIAILIWELTIKGGTQRQALELALSLQNKGHAVDVYCYAYDKKETYNDLCDKLTIYSVTDKKKRGGVRGAIKQESMIRKSWNLFKIYAVLVRNMFFVEKQIVELKKLIERNHPLSYYDVINLHDYEVYKLSRIVHHNNLVWMMNDLQRSPTAGKRPLPFIGILQKILIKLEIENIRAIAVLDNRNKFLCKKHYGRDAAVVRSGIDLDMFRKFKEERRFFRGRYAIFASSIFFPWRRFEDLVDAVEILVVRGHKNIHVTINGINDRAYDYYLSIRDRIARKNLGSYITIINGMSEETLMRTYVETDIFVFPNNHQTWGLAVFEAMLAGCVSIVSKGAGAHEVLTDKENALLVNPESPKEIANAIMFLLDHPKEMERISKNGMEFVIENLSWDMYADQMLRVFKTQM